MSDSEFEAAARTFDFIERCTADREAGQMHDLAWYLERFPGNDKVIAIEYSRLHGVGALENTRVEDPSGLHVALEGYDLIGELGRGGQGVVWLARDLGIDRLVAIKLIDSPLMSSTRVERLRREVQIVGGLDHPHICSIHGAQLDGSPYYVVMGYVEGESLAQVIARHKADHEHVRRAARGPIARLGSRTTPSSGTTPSTISNIPCLPMGTTQLRSTLLFIERTARALHKAHEAGVIHRDVKPANIMVDAQGEPVLLDFGLARREGGDAETLTHTGDILGTPPYMAPEQFSDQGDSLDQRADVFSLGITLFECLTLQRPFQASVSTSLELAIREQRMPAPRRWNAFLPGDLCVVLETALAKERSRRYASALDFAEDLRRVRNSEPILAARTRRLTRLKLWSRRNPLIATLSAALFFVLLGAVWVLQGLLGETRDERDAKDAALAGFLHQRLVVDANSMLKAHSEIALYLASEAVRRDPTFDANTVLMAALDEHRVGFALSPMGSMSTLAVPTNSHVLVGEGEHLTVFDVRSNWKPLNIAVSSYDTAFNRDRHRRFAMSPGGELVAVAVPNGAVRVIDIETRQTYDLVAPYGDSLSNPVFGPTGSYLVATAHEGAVCVWDMPSPTHKRMIETGSQTQDTPVFSPDGERLLTFARDDIQLEPTDIVAHVWALDTDIPPTVLRGHRAGLRQAIFSPQGDLVATASYDGTARIWDARTGQVRHVLAHPGKVHSLCMSPDGKTLVTGCDPGSIETEAYGARAWNVTTGKNIATLPAHANRAVSKVAYSPDGQAVLAASYDGTVSLWDASTFELTTILNGASASILQCYWVASDGIVATDQRGSSWRWNIAEPMAPMTLLAADRGVRRIDYDATGRHLVSVSDDGRARVWDTTTGRPRSQPLVDHDAGLTWVDVDASDTVAIASKDGTVFVLNLDGTHVTRLDVGDGVVERVHFIPSENRVLTVSENGTLRLWERDGTRLNTWAGHDGTVLDVAWDPAGRWIASAGSDRSVRIWMPGQPTAHLVLDPWDGTGNESRVFALGVTKDGATLAVASADGHVRSYRTLDFQLVADWSGQNLGALIPIGDSQDEDWLSFRKWQGNVALIPAFGKDEFRYSREQFRSLVLDLVLSPDETLCLLTKLNGSALVHSSTSLEAIVRLDGHTGPVVQGLFRPDGAQMATASLDGTIRLWPIDMMAEINRREAPAIPQTLLAKYGLGDR